MSKTILSQRQENFCLNIVSGVPPGESAITAGYAPRFASIDAHKILRNPKIIARLAELRLPIAQAVIATRDELGEGYTEIFRKEATETKDKVAVGKELSQLYGYYSPNKTDHTFNGEGLAEVLSKLRGYKQIDKGRSQVDEEGLNGS